MKKLFYILLGLTILGCSSPDPTAMIKNLDGYWQIEKVTLPNGEERSFSLSTTIDYIEVIEDSSGIRKKVVPKLDGTFKVTKSTERFTIKIENDSLNLYYQTPYNTWKETVLQAKDSTLVVINKERKKYTYKRFKNFSFQDYE